MTPSKRTSVAQLITQRRALAAALVASTAENDPEQLLLSLSEVLAVVPMGETAWRRGVKEGNYPQPIVLSKRKIFWRARDIENLLQSGPAAAANANTKPRRQRAGRLS